MNDIQLSAVSKFFKIGLYRKKLAVDSLSFEVPQGEVVGLLGANGSGKSTTIKMMLGFLRPTQGELIICGYPASNRRARTFLGYLPENPRFQKFLTASEILRYHGRLLGLPSTNLIARTEYLIDLVGLKEAATERTQGYSKGMIQRLAIAQSLLNLPRLLIFDEPMSGLDPIGRIEIRRLISRIHEDFPKTTLFFSTHILEDVEALCSSVILLKKGKLKVHCNIDKLLATTEHRFEIIATQLGSLSEKYIKNFQAKWTPLGFSWSLEGMESLLTTLSEIQRSGGVLIHLSSMRRNLEEALFTDRDLEDIVAVWKTARQGVNS